MNHRPLSTLVVILTMMLAACGGAPDQDAGTVQTGTPEPATSGGAPYPLFARQLHSGIELPPRGQAEVRVADQVFRFTGIHCELVDVDEGRGEGFRASGRGTLEDGRVTRFSVFRSVNTSGRPAAGASWETDVIDLWVQQSRNEALESNSFLRGDRMQDGGRVRGRAGELPFVHVVRDGEQLTATAVGEIRLMSANMPDAAPTGEAQFAVHCGDNAPEPEPEPEPINAFVKVDGVDQPLAQVQCAAVGGGSTWRVAALFDIEPLGRFYFDVRSEIDADGQRVERPRQVGQPNVTLQWPYGGDDNPSSAEFLTANSLAYMRGGDTRELEFSRAGSSGIIEVAIEIAGNRPPEDRDFTRTVEYDIACP